ncbi:hypothetical protein JCM13304A_04770 [Desulfothermus okinawensis JCM 13304]
MLREDLSPTTKETIKQNDLEELKKDLKDMLGLLKYHLDDVANHVGNYLALERAIEEGDAFLVLKSNTDKPRDLQEAIFALEYLLDCADDIKPMVLESIQNKISELSKNVVDVCQFVDEELNIKKSQ